MQSLSVRKVVGVEMVEQAVDDARVNATLNGKLHVHNIIIIHVL